MRGAVAILCGVASVVMTAIPLAWLGHGVGEGAAWLALLLGLVVAIAVFRRIPTSPVSPISWMGWIMITVYACASARVFFWLIYPSGDVWRILSPNNLGDIALHLSLIRWLAAAPHWWPSSPILAGDPLRYPPGSDLFNAVLLRAGVPAETGLVWCGLVGAALAGISLWRWGRTVALAALLFNGGLGALLFLRWGWCADPDADLQWKNLFLSIFVTQRGFLFALPSGLLLLSVWREEFFADRARWMPSVVQILLLAAMPLFSVHSALFLVMAMIGIWVLKPGTRNMLGRLALRSWPLMALNGWLVTTGAGGAFAGRSLGIAPGWMSDGTRWFWILNFGITMPLAVFFCGWLFRRGASAEARAFVWPAALVFVSCMVIRFAPWPWDNTKLMLWSWIVIAPYLWAGFFASRALFVRVFFAILIFGSGALTLAAGLDVRHGYELVKRSELDRTAKLLREVPPGAVIACAPEYNNPVLMLGHPVVCGYEGHLWSHGLDYKRRLARLNTLMRGEAGWEKEAMELGVSHIVWGDAEAARWPDSKLPWAKEPGLSLHAVDRHR